MKTRGICVCALLVVLAVVTLPMSLGAADSGGATCQPPASSSTQDSKMSTGTQGVYGPGTSAQPPGTDLGETGSTTGKAPIGGADVGPGLGGAGGTSDQSSASGMGTGGTSSGSR